MAKIKNLRYAHFGRPLTEEEIAQYAPSVINDRAPDITRVTNKYSFFPTITLIRDLRTIGWIPYAVEQRNVYSPDRKDFTKHMVVFRNPDISEENNLVPEIVLTNSHDGRNSFEFYAGVYHVVKEMSFIVYHEATETTMEEFRVKHQGYTLDEVKKVIDKVLEIIPEIYDKVRQMSKIVLTHKQKLVFAIEAVKQRWKDTKQNVDFEDIIQPIREDEHKSTLWNIFQVVQEKIVSGGIKYEIRHKNGKIRKQTARALVNIDQKIEVKKSIWKVAIDMIASVQKTEVKEQAA